MSEHEKNQGGTESRREWEEKQQIGKRTEKKMWEKLERGW